jgi:uncharacterized membrane protein
MYVYDCIRLFVYVTTHRVQAVHRALQQRRHIMFTSHGHITSQHIRFALYDLRVCIRSVSMYMIRLFVYVTTHQVQAVHRALLYMSHNTTGSSCSPCSTVHVPQHIRFALYDLRVCIRSVSMYMIRLFVYVTTHQVQAVHRALLYMSHNTTGSSCSPCSTVHVPQHNRFTLYDPSVCIRSVCMYVYDLHVCIRSACMYMIRLYVYVTTHRVQARLLLYFTITIQHVHTIRSACMPI